MKQTWYELFTIVSPDLKRFRDDLELHDKNILAKYDGPFIYGYRASGTDLLKMLPMVESYEYSANCPIDEFEKLLREDVMWVTYTGDRNTKFLYFDGKKLHSKTREQVEKIYLCHVAIIINAYKQQVAAI